MLCNAQRSRPLIDMTLHVIGLLPQAALNQKPLDGQLRGQTPLHIVSGGRDIEDARHRVIAKLVNCKADMEARDLNGRTPLLVAAGAAYRNGAERLFGLGANMRATKPGGRNFADEALGSNKKMADWWCDKTGLQPSGAPKEAKTGIFKREGVSAKRHTRMVERRAACSQTWDDSSWYHGWHGGWSNGFWNDGGASSSAQASSRPLESWTTARNARDKRR